MKPRRIVTIQAQIREVGRLRMGVQEPYQKDGVTKYRPAKLDTFRLTSRDETAIRAAADVYGGQPAIWEGAPEQTGRQWEVVITAPFLEVMIPPNGYESSFELWSAGGCQRRCNGEFDEITRGRCLCPADPQERSELAKKGQACKPTSRLRVLLPKLPSVGMWRLESHGYFAAVELGGMADLLEAATLQGYAVNAQLRIERRIVKRPGEERRDFIVPVLEIPDLTPQQVLGAGEEVRQIGPGSTTPDPPRAPMAEDEIPEGELVEPATAEDRMTLAEFTAMAREHGVNLGFCSSQARLRFNKALPDLSDAERWSLAATILVPE
jgi:hypothetical protein